MDNRQHKILQIGIPATSARVQYGILVFRDSQLFYSVSVTVTEMNEVMDAIRSYLTVVKFNYLLVSSHLQM